MNDINNPLLKTLIGKTIKSVIVGTSHGEFLKFEFDDGTKLGVCTYDPIEVKRGDRRNDELYIGINEIEL
jgi:hypothetical protein